MASREEHVVAHLTRWVGEPEAVLEGPGSEEGPVHVHLIPPGPTRACWTLFTTGMSARPMAVPEGAEDFRLTELVLRLPADWPFTEEALQEERWGWPVRWLHLLTGLPHEQETWLGWGQVVPNGEPPQPFAPGTRLCALLLTHPFWLPEEAWAVELPGEERVLLSTVLPLTPEEVDFTHAQGAQALLAALLEAGVTEVVRPERPSVVPGGHGP
jgi:hypothetical protein